MIPVPSELPVLYSFRRCPYAIRARMAIRYSGLSVALREVVLRDMPAALLQCSPKGTVPVLVLPDGRVLEESRDIIDWALAQHDPDQWRPQSPVQQAALLSLLNENDGAFKQSLDRYKYAERYPEHPAAHYRAAGECFLTRLERLLARHDWLLGGRMGVADIAILPFVRQFAQVDADGFRQAPCPHLQDWLGRLLHSTLFTGVMHKYPPWREGDAVRVFP
jgi:glutathione S-transferase